MKMRKLILAAILVFIVSAHPAHAMYNRFATAQSMNQGQMESGISAGYGDENDYDFKYFYLYPYFRYGLGYLIEIEGKIGVISVDKKTGSDDIGILGGVGLKYQIIKETQTIPIDIALAGGYAGHIINLNSFNEFYFAALVSKTFDVSKFKITPYGGPEIAYTSGSYVSEGKADVFGIVGADFKFTESLAAGAELKFGTDWATGLSLKIRF